MDERVTADSEWRATNEPRITALEASIADKVVCLELAAGEKSQMLSETADLKEKLLKAEERIMQLEAANSALNTAQDKAIASRISTQEELSFCKSNGFKKNIINDFKSSIELSKKIGCEAGSFLDKPAFTLYSSFIRIFRRSLFF